MSIALSWPGERYKQLDNLIDVNTVFLCNVAYSDNLIDTIKHIRDTGRDVWVMAHINQYENVNGNSMYHTTNIHLHTPSDAFYKAIDNWLPLVDRIFLSWTNGGESGAHDVWHTRSSSKTVIQNKNFIARTVDELQTLAAFAPDVLNERKLGFTCLDTPFYIEAQQDIPLEDMSLVNYLVANGIHNCCYSGAWIAYPQTKVKEYYVDKGDGSFPYIPATGYYHHVIGKHNYMHYLRYADCISTGIGWNYGISNGNARTLTEMGYTDVLWFGRDDNIKSWEEYNAKDDT